MFSVVFSFGETEPCAQSLSPYSSFVIARKRAVLALRAEFLFLSFPKEKGTKKKGNLRACALKNPLIVQSFCAQSKTSCLPFSQLQVPLRRTLSRFVALRRASRGEICTKRKKRRVCTNITSSAPKPSALDRRSQCNLNRESQCIEGKALLRIKILCQHNKSRAKSNSDHQNSYFAAILAVGAAMLAVGAAIG